MSGREAHPRRAGGSAEGQRWACGAGAWTFTWLLLVLGISGVQASGSWAQEVFEPGAGISPPTELAPFPAADSALGAPGAAPVWDGTSGFGGSGAGADCGFNCPDRWYVVAESFWLNRQDDENFSLSNGLSGDDFGYDWAGRITLGRTFDCLDGWEVTYTGPFRWDQQESVRAANQLNARFLPGNNVTAADLSTFYNADVHFQQYASELHMVEYNRRWWGWDVFSLKVGSRYIDLQEGYQLRSTDNGDVGQLVIEGNNRIGLAQLGIDMLAPVGRWTYGAKLTGGLGINFNEGNYLVTNDGTPVVFAGDQSEELAWMIETGLYTNYRLTRRFTLHAGYELMYLAGLNLPAEQDLRYVNFDSGEAFDERGDILYHGFTAGVEFVW